jgi:hypothetical protein
MSGQFSSFVLLAIAASLAFGCAVDVSSSPNDGVASESAAVVAVKPCTDAFEACVYETDTDGPWIGSYSPATKTCSVVTSDGVHHTFTGQFQCGVDALPVSQPQPTWPWMWD